MSELLNRILVKVVVDPLRLAELASVRVFNSVDRTVLIFDITLSTIVS